MDEESLARELAEIDKALSETLAGGQSHSLASGGGSWAAAMPDYAALVKRKKELLYELSCIQGGAALSVTFGW
jgi:hypothetical protein